MAGWVPLLVNSVLLSLLFPLTSAIDDDITVYAILPMQRAIDRDEAGILQLFANVPQKLLLVGNNISNEVEIAFTPEDKKTCENVKRSKSFKPISVNEKNTSAEFEIKLDKLDPGEELYYLCVKFTQALTFDFKGNEPWLQLAIKEVLEEGSTIFPIPVQALIITLLLFLSGLFSGLNLGLMALDKTELQIIERCGSPNEKKYAKTITPLRKRGNFLLCTLLLGNVMVNSTATILLDDLSNGIVAVVVSTICIVVFGEIIPQAVCSRHGLAVGAKTAWITRFFMLVTFPLSFPISLLLDKVLGEEIGQVYDKEKLQELIRMTADHKMLQNDEANIIAGALQLANKRVEDVMTKMEDVYMLDVNTVLDFETMSEILKSGYTRVPVYDDDITNIVHLLNTKELALIDPDDNTPLKTVCRFYDHRPLYVDYDVRLDAMLQEFLQGNSHMAIVQRLQNEGDHDPYYENIGVVTLEDVIEEIIQSEIIDETDILTDNRRKKPRRRQQELEYSVFEQKQEHGPRISQQVAFAAYQFLSTAVEPFKDQYIARSVLKQLIRQNIFITMTPSSQDVNKSFLFKRGDECDYFVLLLEGHVEVEIGKENLVFESGPFNYFGGECLDCLRDIKIESLKDSRDLRSLPPYIPDFSVRAITPVQYLRIRRVHYLAARRTSYMMLSLPAAEDHCHEEAFHKEWHRTVAPNAISRNNSAAGMADMVETTLTPLEYVHKRALLSEGSLKERVLANSSSSHLSSSKEDNKGSRETVREDGGDGKEAEEKSKAEEAADDAGSTAETKKSLGDERQTAAVEASPMVFHGSRTHREEGDTDPLLPNGSRTSDQKGVGNEPEVAVVGGDDKAVPNAKEKRTSGGERRDWGEEEDDESHPLVAKADNRAVKL